MAYTTKFYDYEKLKSYNNIFYDKKIGKGAKVPEQIIEKYAKLPTLIFLKLRLKESELKLENSDTENIKRTRYDKKQRTMQNAKYTVFQ